MTYPSLHQAGHIYFVTASICGWKPLFRNESYAQIILNSLSWFREKHICKIFAFVVMPTHIHILLFPITFEISHVIQRFGSYTAHAILTQLKEDESEELLEYFRGCAVDKREKFRIWQDIQAENIFTTAVAEQKLDYIHQNPARGNPPLVLNHSEYLYSSARFYDDGLPSIIPLDDLRDFLSE